MADGHLHLDSPLSGGSPARVYESLGSGVSHGATWRAPPLRLGPASPHYLADFRGRGISQITLSFWTHGVVAFLDGPTMGTGRRVGEASLDVAQPFLDRVFGPKARDKCARSRTLSLLIRSCRPQERSGRWRAVALVIDDHLHHFIAGRVWDAGPVETELLVQADNLVGVQRFPCWVILATPSIPRETRISVGVARCAMLLQRFGKTALARPWCR